MNELLDDHYPNKSKNILLKNNLNKFPGSWLYEAFSPYETKHLLKRLEIHYTLRHGSWLNIGEIELKVLIGQCLNRRILGKQTLELETAQLEYQRNFLQSNSNFLFSINKTVSNFCNLMLQYLYNIKLGSHKANCGNIIRKTRLIAWIISIGIAER